MTIKIWKVWGTGLTVLYIIGKDMDEVLAQARLINPNYNSVQLYSKEEIQWLEYILESRKSSLTTLNI